MWSPASLSGSVLVEREVPGLLTCGSGPGVGGGRRCSRDTQLADTAGQHVGVRQDVDGRLERRVELARPLVVVEVRFPGGAIVDVETSAVHHGESVHGLTEQAGLRALR